MMNHDAAHCMDYEPGKCPKRCYRAELAEELKERRDLTGIPISWAHFLGTRECWRNAPKEAAPVRTLPYSDDSQ